MVIVTQDMDLLDDFDFDPEEVIYPEDGGVSLEAAPFADQLYAEPSADQISNYPCQYEEIRTNQPAIPAEQSVDQFEDLDDAALEEALQQAPENLCHQKLSHRKDTSTLQCADDSIFNEDLQMLDGLDHQAPFQAKSRQPSQQRSNTVHGKEPQDTKGATSVQTSHDEQYMSSLDDLAFEEVDCREQELRSVQVPKQTSTSSQGHFLPQQRAQEAEVHVHRDITIDTAPEEIILQSEDTPSRDLTTSEQPGEDSLNTQALSEAMQYAYENDLTSDYLLKSFSLTHVLSPLAQSTIPAVNDDGFTHHSHLTEAEIPNLIVLDKFKILATTPEALRLIAEARLIRSDEVIQSLTKEVINADILTQMKLELPILRTDNERDMAAFQKRYPNRSEALLRSIKEHRLPLYPQNLADGEGMELSSKARAECKIMQKKSQEEKVGVTRECLTYLFSLLKDEYTTEDRMRHIVDEIQYKKTPRIEKVTPPVSPKLVPEQSAPVFDPQQLPIHSNDSSSLLSDNFDAIEDFMLMDHKDIWSASTSPIREFLKDSFTIAKPDLFERPGQILEDLRVEVPLMLDDDVQQSGPAEPGAFGAFVESQMDLDPEFERAVLHDIPDDIVQEALQDQLEESAQNALRCIEQEQLQVIDAVARVPVPVVDFLIAEPSWQHLCGKEHSDSRMLKWIQAGKEELFTKPPIWPIDKASESKMVWNPLTPGAGVVPEQEYMPEGEPLLKRYLNLPPSDEVHKSLDCTRRREKASVFDNDDRDEEIEYQIRMKRPVVNLMHSVAKRSMGTDAEGTAKRSRRRIIDQTSLDQLSECAGPSLLPDDSCSASGNLLATFMEVNAPKRKVSTHSKYFTPTEDVSPLLSARNLAVSKQDTLQDLGKPRAGFKAPYPIIEPPPTSLTVFIDIKIPRRMIRTLEELIPGLTLLERDYESHNTSVWKPSSVRRTEVTPPLADDADITISPSTGIIITSMIRIRQRPRAGTNKGIVQIRVEKASLRYERLIVLVSGDVEKDEIVDLMSPSDSSALLELHGFVSGLESNVQVHYVGGGNKTLTHWVATFICRYGLVDQHIVSSLLESETLWEVFLRRAGFNVFAAQVVASQFKPPSEAIDTMNSAPCGLSAFMIMSRDERVRRFGDVIGARTLDRVSRILEQLWNCG